MRLLTRLFYLIIGMTSCGLIAAFVIVNNTVTTVRIWPSNYSISAELWVFILGGFILGMLIGGSFIWFNHLPMRAKLWQRERQISKLSSALQDAEKKSDEQLLPEQPDSP